MTNDFIISSIRNHCREKKVFHELRCVLIWFQSKQFNVSANTFECFIIEAWHGALHVCNDLHLFIQLNKAVKGARSLTEAWMCERDRPRAIESRASSVCACALAEKKRQPIDTKMRQNLKLEIKICLAYCGWWNFAERRFNAHPNSVMCVCLTASQTTYRCNLWWTQCVDVLG